MKRLFAALMLLIVGVLSMSLWNDGTGDSLPDLAATAASGQSSLSVAHDRLKSAQGAQAGAMIMESPSVKPTAYDPVHNRRGAIIVVATAGVLVVALVALWIGSTPFRREREAGYFRNERTVRPRRKEPSLQE